MNKMDGRGGCKMGIVTLKPTPTIQVRGRNPEPFLRVDPSHNPGEQFSSSLDRTSYLIFKGSRAFGFRNSDLPKGDTFLSLFTKPEERHSADGRPTRAPSPPGFPRAPNVTGGCRMTPNDRTHQIIRSTALSYGNFTIEEPHSLYFKVVKCGSLASIVAILPQPYSQSC